MPPVLLRIIVSATVLTAPLLALDPAKTLTQYAHRIWGHEEGLFQPTVFSIVQTRDGFLWLGTQDSLIRFDGMHFRDFERDNQQVFEHTLIHDLSEDPRGNLWIASLGSGAAKLAPDGTLTRYTTRNGLPNDSVFCVAPDTQGRTWMCTAQGLAVVDGARIKTFTTVDGLPTNRIRSTCEAGDGVRWVAGLDFGLARSNGSRFEPYVDRHIGAREIVTALACGRDGSIWAGTEAGLLQIHGHASRRLTTRDGLPDNAVSALAESPDGAIWIGTNDGISRYHNGDISVYRTRDGLSHSLVLSLYFDREGTLWAGTKDGLDQFTDGDVTPYTTNEGLLSNAAGPVIEDREGHLWIGTLDRGLDWFDGRRFRSVTERDGLLDNKILSLETDAHDNLWVGTRRGLNRLRGGHIAASYTARDGLSGPEVHSLTVDTAGTLWAGTNRGLDRFDGRRFRPAAAPAVNRDSVVSLEAGHHVQLFASTGAPAFYLLQNGAWRNYWLDTSHPVDCYYADYKRRITWMGTLGSGLLRWRNGLLTHIRIKDGLYDNRIYSILNDGHANLWFASSKGIFRIAEQELNDFADGKLREVTSIPFTTGQLRFECQAGVQPAAARTRDGRLWFSTTSGLVMIDPGHLPGGAMPPPVAITGIVIDGRRLDPSRALVLKPSEKNVEIRYAGLSFVMPEMVSFRYILQGYDKSWTDAGTRRAAFFTNLPPGNFVFKVLARSATGAWSKEAATLSFVVEPRLYQRAWFSPALAALCALALAAAWRMRIRRLKGRFDLVLAERTRIARELHDTLLQGLSGITMQMQALWTRLPASTEKHTLGEIIADAARCSAEARRSLWGLRSEDRPKHEFAAKLDKLAREVVAGSPTCLRVDLQLSALRLSPEIEYQVLRIAREAISNAVRHARASKLTVAATATPDRLELIVEDNGTGFTRPAAEDGLCHFGLLGMEERAKEIGATLEVRSSSGEGTRVSLSVPLSTSPSTIGNPETVLTHQ